MTRCNSQNNFCNYQNLTKTTTASLFQHELLGSHAYYALWVEKQRTHNWTLHLTRGNVLQMEHRMTANTIGKSYYRLEQKPVKTAPVPVTLRYLGGSPRDHRCLCSASITAFMSLLFFLKTLSPACTTKPLNCAVWWRWRSCTWSLLSTAPRLSVWPSHLRSWPGAGDPVRPGPAQHFSSREQWQTASELSSGKQGSSPAPQKAKLKAGKLASANVRGAGLGETDDNMGVIWKENH